MSDELGDEKRRMGTRGFKRRYHPPEKLTVAICIREEKGEGLSETSTRSWHARTNALNQDWHNKRELYGTRIESVECMEGTLEQSRFERLSRSCLWLVNKGAISRAPLYARNAGPK